MAEKENEDLDGPPPRSSSSSSSSVGVFFVRGVIVPLQNPREEHEDFESR